MKKNLAVFPFLLSSIITSQHSLAETDYKKSYTPPSRGFVLEHGNVNAGDYISVELHSGSGNLDNGGGIRIGLPNSELILNNGASLASPSNNNALLKWGLPKIKSDGQQTSDQFKWALLAGLSTYDFDGSTSDTTDLRVGLSASLSAEAIKVTVSPSIVYSSTANDSDTYIEVGLGAYAGLIDTESGLFSIGSELILSTQDDQPNTGADEGNARALIGARWSYNERVNIDIIPVVFSDDDFLGIPGMVRLNTVF